MLTKEQVKDLKNGDIITLAGIKWSKFAEDLNGNAYMLADDTICDMEFGKNNDWRDSPIRTDKLNKELHDRIIAELGQDALIAIQTDLFSHDGLRDYGVCEDKISLLTYDLYRNNRMNIKKLDKAYWLNTPDSTPSGRSARCVRFVRTSGLVDYFGYDWNGGVRPFCILNSSVFVS